jgi:hypothetical protein
MLGSVRSTIRSTPLQAGRLYDRISYRPAAGSLRMNMRGWSHAVQRGPSKYRLWFMQNPKSQGQERTGPPAIYRAATEPNIRLISAPVQVL